MDKVRGISITDEQVNDLTNRLLETYGVDFTGYSLASLKRRINRLYQIDEFTAFVEFEYKILTSTAYLRRFIDEVTVNVTEMFRDPQFYFALRNHVLPALNAYPLIRIWVAGCSTGEEAYSVSILLEEMGLKNKSLIYATDINTTVLDAAREGTFPMHYMRQYSINYNNSGGTDEFSRYYNAHYNVAKFHDRLKERMIFSSHNLISDHSFNSFQLIMCRNVLIYFDRDFQDRVIGLFDDSLEPGGFLALGSKETLNLSAYSKRFTQLPGEKIWKKQA